MGKTGAELFDALQALYGSVDAMNAAIGKEWSESGFSGLRLGAAARLLEKRSSQLA